MLTTTPSYKVSNPAGHHLYVLDGLRAVAVSTVILHHYGASHFPGGFLGVDLFFVLSGFLITRLLVMEYNATGIIRFDLFYLRRACRLLPPIVTLLVAVTLLRALMPLTFSANASWWFSDLAVLFFFADFFSSSMNFLGHTWSLSVEEQFYLVWPMILAIILRHSRTISGRIGVALVLALAGAILRMWLETGNGRGVSLYYFPFARMDSLLIGAALALSDSLPWFAATTAKLCRFRPAEIAAVIFALAIVAIRKNVMPAMFYGGFTFIAIVFAVLIGALVYDPRRTLLKRFLEWHPVVWMGRRSYGIYLYHLPVFYLLQPMHEKFPGKIAEAGYLAVAFTLPVVLAALSYRYVEMPFLKRKVHLKWNSLRREAAFTTA